MFRSACLKVDLIDSFWQELSWIRSRVASTDFKYKKSVLATLLLSKRVPVKNCQSGQPWSSLQIRKEDSHYHVHSTLTHQTTCYAIEEVGFQNWIIFEQLLPAGNHALYFKRVRCPASIVHMLPEQVLHKANMARNYWCYQRSSWDSTS